MRIAGELSNSHIHKMTECSSFAKAVLNMLRGRGVLWLCKQLLQGEAQGEKGKEISTVLSCLLSHGATRGPLWTFLESPHLLEIT